MRAKLRDSFHYYFPNAFEMHVVGITLLLLSTPGLAMIFVTHDDIIPGMFSGVRPFGIAWGCASALFGAVLIFFGIRRSAMPGTFSYRLTHKRRD